MDNHEIRRAGFGLTARTSTRNSREAFFTPDVAGKPAKCRSSKAKRSMLSASSLLFLSAASSTASDSSSDQTVGRSSTKERGVSRMPVGRMLFVCYRLRYEVQYPLIS